MRSASLLRCPAPPSAMLPFPRLIVTRLPAQEFASEMREMFAASSSISLLSESDGRKQYEVEQSRASRG
eukprot:761841-Hanusia_phi.AAC.4